MSEPEIIFDIYRKALLKDLLNSPELESIVDAKVQQRLDAMRLNKQYYTPEELAEHLKIKKQTVYSHVRRGLLKPEWSGRNMRFSYEAVQNYLR